MFLNTAAPLTIDEYIARQPADFRFTLNELRSIILAVAPGAEQLISYQVPSFKYLYMLVGIGVSKKYCSFYIMSSALSKEFKQELQAYGLSGTTLHFLPGAPLPVALIKQITLARMAKMKCATPKRRRNNT